MASGALPNLVSQPTVQAESPLDAMSRGLSLQQLAQTTQINAQRLQEEKMKVQAATEDREDEATIQKEFLNPAHRKVDADTQVPHFDFNSFRDSLQGKVRMRSLQRLDTDHLQQVKAVQDMATADRTNGTAKINELAAHNKIIGQEIQGLEQLSDADKPAYYVGALQRLKAAGIDISQLPPTIPADGSMNSQLNAYAASAGYNGTILNDHLKQQRQEQLAADTQRKNQQAETQQHKDEADTKQREREDVSRAYLKVRTPDDHDQWAAMVAKDHPTIANDYVGLQFDPKSTPGIVQGMALNSQQRATDAMTQQARNAGDLRASVAGGRTGLVIRASDPTLSPEDHQAAVKALNLWEQSNAREQTANSQAIQDRFEQREADRQRKDASDDAKLHDTLQRQEQAQWQIKQRYGNAIADAGGAATVSDPRTNKSISAADAESQMREAESKARSYAGQAEELRKRHQWGEFSSVAAPAKATPPPTPPPPDTAGLGAPPGVPGAPLPHGLKGKPTAAPPKAETPPPRPQGEFSVHLSPELAKKFGKQYLYFKDEDTAHQFAAKAGLNFK